VCLKPRTWKKNKRQWYVTSCNDEESSLLFLFSSCTHLLFQSCYYQSSDSSYINEDSECSLNDDALLQDKDEEKENVPLQISVTKKRKSKAKSSWVWCYFKPSANGDETKNFCALRSQDVHYGRSHSTWMLGRHIKNIHAKLYSDMCAQCA
jgi:hypothetical protein